MSDAIQTTADLCKHDGKPCYASAGTNDAHWRCGTVQCGPAQTQTTSRYRPARNPGGVECSKCECIFIGEEWHTLCRICIEEVAADIVKVQHG